MADSPEIPPTPGADVIADPADAEKNKVFAILAYLGILVLVPILAAKESPFARYHANQGLILLISSIATGFVLMIFVFLLAVIPILGKLACCFGPMMWFAYMIGMLIFTVLGIINAIGGKMKPLPLIGTLVTLIK